MGKNNDDNSSHNFEVAKFIGNQHLTDIREIKNHQRNITFQYILIAIAITGLIKIKPTPLNVIFGGIEIYFWIKAINVLFGLFVIWIIVQLQRSLSSFRKRIYNIWKQPYFKHAFDEHFLNADKEDPCKYFSHWYQWYYPAIYIALVIMVMVSLILFLQM